MRQVFTDREQEPQAPAATPLPDQQIRVLPESTTPRVNPFLDNAYRALQAGKLAQAEDLYQHALKGEQNNVDALLGLAVIASNQGSPDTAGRYYLRVLEIDPRNVIAQAGLIALFGRSDPAAEGRLQRLIQQHPAPFLHFTLGNLHAEQGRWAPAEQDYFHAYQMEPTNPDYALNLAISLDHLGQQKPALTYYQLALSLAQDKGSARFDRDMIAMRIAQLKAASRIISDGKQ
jgi:tetratricopeptide (TPR) repeat protein